MFENVYLINWDLYFIQMKNHYELLREIKKK